MKNGNIILALVIFLGGFNLAPVDMVARDVQAEISSSLSAQHKHVAMTRLHEVSQLRSNHLRGKHPHHPTQRPGDPFSIHHARPFFIITYQDEEAHAILTSSFSRNTPIYIGSFYPSDYISKIFHPPAV